MTEDSTLLDVDQAAARLGVSTLRIRQMILEGRLDGVRDNRGHLRLRAPLEPRPRPTETGTHKQELAVELLLDEIMELRHALGEKQQSFDALSGIAARQQAALERALALVERRGATPARMDELMEQRDRAVALADRALDMIDKSPAAPARLAKTNSLLDRVLRLLDRRERR